MVLLHKGDDYLHHRGVRGLILYFRGIRSCVMNYLSGNPERPTGVRLTKDGIPVDLGPWIERLRSIRTPNTPEKAANGIKVLAILTTVLFSTRALKAGSQPDIRPITDPGISNLSERIDEVSKYCKKF
jgi:hypothetical protein